MTIALETSLGVALKAKLTNPLDLTTPKDELLKNIAFNLATGTGSGEANRSFHDSRTLTTGATEDIDLSGSLTDAFGNSIVLASVKVLLIYNTSTTQTLTVGGAAANQFINWVADASDKVNIPPGGMLLLVAPGAGYEVTAATGDLLKIANSAGASCVYQIVIIGATA